MPTKTLFAVAFTVSAVTFAQPPTSAADTAKVKQEFLPRPVTLKADAMPLSKALAELARQSGNQVADRRAAKTDPTLKLQLENTSFWPALEAIAKAAGCNISTFQADAQVSLVDGSFVDAPTAYAGVLRVRARRVGVDFDYETKVHNAKIGLDIAWEPRFQPLYLETGPVEAVFAADPMGKDASATMPSRGKSLVADHERVAYAVNVIVPAPARSSPKIKCVKGVVKLTSAAKMLTFSFPGLKALKKGDEPLTQTRDGVQVSVVQIKPETARWSVEVHISNPPGNPVFESYQSWLGNNRMSLEKGEGASRAIWAPKPEDEQVLREDRNATRAEIVYRFEVGAKQSKGTLSDWTLVYRTPGPIVEVDVPFELKGLALP